MTTGLVAVRRNLTPGAVFFRQIGNVVEYSLDRVTWYYAFTLPRGSGTQISQDVYNSFESMSIQDFINFNTSIYIAPNAVTSTTIDQIAEGAGKIGRNLCTGAKVLAATFVALVNVHLEDESDGQLDLVSAGTALAGVVLDVAVRVFGRGIGEIAVKWIQRAVMTNYATSAAAAWWSSLNNVQDLTDCDTDAIACAIYRASLEYGANKDAVGGALITHFDFDACPNGNMNIVLTEWFSAWIDDWPELWPAYLAGLTDGEISTCECGGCMDLMTIDASITPGAAYRLLNGTIKTTPDNTAYGGNFKGMTITYNNLQIGAQIDTVTLNFVTSEYQKSSSLGWSLTPIEVEFGAQAGATIKKSKTITEVSPTIISNTRRVGGVQQFVFDYSADTLVGGSNGYLAIVKRTAYATTGLGADSVFIGGRVCYRGP